MFSPLDAADFADALNSDRGLSLPISAEGHVRKTTDKAVIEFSPSGAMCLSWIKIPLNMIDKVQPLGKRPCIDGLHDYVVLHFKPPDDPVATVFAELLQHAAVARSSTTCCGAEHQASVENGSDAADISTSGQWCCRVWIYPRGGGLLDVHKQTHNSAADAYRDCDRVSNHFQKQGWRTKQSVSSGGC